MPDSFTNARPYFDVTFPSSGDGFSISGFRNALAGLGFLDMIPLQPRAHNPANTSIMVRGRDASGFFNPVYAGDADKRLFFSSGDSMSFTAPTSNPRIDIIYLTPSGDIRSITGTEAATPTLPSLSPSGDTRIPICAIYHKTSQTKIVNFEDKDSNTGDGYIYQDLRPWLHFPQPSPRKFKVVNLQDATTINFDASQGDEFHISMQGNRTIAIPSGLITGTKFILRLKALGADRTPTLASGDNGFRYSTDVPVLTAILQGQSDYIGVIYNELDRRCDVVTAVKSY